MNSNLLRHRNNTSLLSTTTTTTGTIAPTTTLKTSSHTNNRQHHNFVQTIVHNNNNNRRIRIDNNDNNNTTNYLNNRNNQKTIVVFNNHQYNNNTNNNRLINNNTMMQQQSSFDDCDENLNNSNNNTTVSSSSSSNNNTVTTTATNVIIPKLAYQEMNLGSVVGTGGFSVVTAINSIDLDDDLFHYDESNTDKNDNIQQQRYVRKEFVKQLRDSRYVLKTLRNDLPEDEYNKGITDLAIESYFLSILSNEHIISMVAVANTDPKHSRYFVILDRLQQTLDFKFNEWRGKVENATGYYIPCYGYCCSNPVVLHSLWKERFDTAYYISNAIEYLHQNHIIYRDLKPDNIGYDSNGILKIFDFGLAKLIDHNVSKCDAIGCEDLYNLTGNTGSLRYMAPEVALDHPYNYSVDAYSFGILFWQICSLQTPFATFSQKMHAERVVKNGERPRIDHTWPSSWITIQQLCWNHNIKERPTFHYITKQLYDIIQDIVNDDGIVPNKTTEIRAKKRKMKITKDGTRLDIDTRIHTDVDNSTIKKFEMDIV